jgi:hypothetical protein
MEVNHRLVSSSINECGPSVSETAPPDTTIHSCEVHICTILDEAFDVMEFAIEGGPIGLFSFTELLLLMKVSSSHVSLQEDEAL